ncbi:MAG: hypothetical protein LW855_07610 [Alphaproteobacteria bacterium]|nr:hypothetical protein [Alphaproteobacteria bacterium]
MYTYTVFGTVTESTCNTSTFISQNCSISCPPAAKPLQPCDTYRLSIFFDRDANDHTIGLAINGIVGIDGDAPACFYDYTLLRDYFRAETADLYYTPRCIGASPWGKVCQLNVAVYYASPISLLWDKLIRIEDSFTLSTFPLNPDAAAGQTYEWRASGKAPLLVWDEKGDGVITKAAQLFGNYTFGKRWPDGYTALDSLDGDKNGSVSGDELKHIRIWFDDNANGISEPGEVKDLAAVGVTALYTVPDRKDIKTGFIHAKRGYDRVVDGKKVTLPSVDWVAKAYKIPSDVNNVTKAPAPAGGVPASDGGGATPASSSSGRSSGASSGGSSGGGGGSSGAGASASGSGGGAGGGGGGSGGGAAAPAASSKSALGGSSTAKTVAMDIAGIWEITYAAENQEYSVLDTFGMNILPGNFWNQISGYMFEPYGPVTGEPEDIKIKRAWMEENASYMPVYSDTKENNLILRDLFLRGLLAFDAAANQDVSTWGFKYDLTGAYVGNNTYSMAVTYPNNKLQRQFNLIFNDGSDSFKGTMTVQIPGRGQLKREFTGKRLKTYKQ